MMSDLEPCEKRLSAVQREFDAILDPIDLPRTLPQRRVDEYVERRRVIGLNRDAARTALNMLAKPLARRAKNEAARVRTQKARETIEQEIATAAKRGAVPADLMAALDTIDRGADTVGGVAILPARLKTLLTQKCESCGHEHVSWHGAIGLLEQQIAEDTKRITEQLAICERALAGAEAALAAHDPIAEVSSVS